MKNLSRALAIIIFSLFIFSPLKINSTGNLLIVEVQIAGEKSSDDFIKIYNPTNSDIYLGNYQGSYIRLVKRTKNSNKDYTIKSWSKDQTAKIPAGGFYLWANKDYTSLSNVDAYTSQIISPNNGIALRLGPENSGLIIDAVGWGDFNNVLFEGTPFPENPEPNQKIERKKIGQIYQDTDNNANDFYLNPLSKQKNENLKEDQNSTTSLSENSSQLKEAQTITYPSGIIINEILPNPPLGTRDEEGEYIEIFNQNNFEVDLSNWKIEDTTGQTTTYLFPNGAKISAQGFLTLFRPTTKITLNNDGDGLKLIQPDGKIVDSISYEKSPQGKSYNRINDDWIWSSTLTPDKPNIIPSSNRETEKNEPKKEEVKESLPEKELASVSQGIPLKSPNFFSIFLTGFTFSVFSAIIILILKQKLKIDLFKK